MSYACEFYTVISQLYTVIFNCFPHCVVHDRWMNTNQFYCYLMKQILSYYWICYRDNSSLIICVKKKKHCLEVWHFPLYLTGLPIVMSLQVEPSINYQLYTQFLTITVTVYFPFIQPCWAKWLSNAIDKLSKVKDMIFFFFLLWQE